MSTISAVTDAIASRGAVVTGAGRPDDIAGVVQVLGSPEAGYITRRALVADGGWLLF